MKLRWLTIFSCLLITACDGSSRAVSRSNPDRSSQSNTPSDAESRTPEKKPNLSPTDSGSNASQFDAIQARYQSAMQEFMKTYLAADKEDRKMLARDNYPQPEDYAAEFMALAIDHPKSNVAFDSLAWIVSQLQSGELLDQAYEILLADHINNEELKGACISLGYSDPSPKVESRLNLILETSPHDLVKAAAIYALASYLTRVENLQQRLTDNPEAAEFNEETISYLNNRKIEPMTIEEMFKTLVTDYPKIKPFNGSKKNYESMAERALFERQRLGVGMVAPDIEGSDLDGVTFRLSDYRGQVVVLNFWGDW